MANRARITATPELSAARRGSAELATATPPWLAHQMLELAEFRPHEEFLWDPCAGTGGILEAALARGAKNIEYMELNEARHLDLRERGFEGKHADMLLNGPAKAPTLIALNPDFRKNKWVKMLSAVTGWENERLVCVVPTDFMTTLVELAMQHGGVEAAQLLFFMGHSVERFTVANLTPYLFAVDGQYVPTSLLYLKKN